MLRFQYVMPFAGVLLVIAAYAMPNMHLSVALLAAGGLIGAVFAAVHHAELVAHKIGEPFGTLVLAIAVTVIEVALIVSMMMYGGAGAAALPRDTVYAAIMIICTGLIGLCLLVGAWTHQEQTFRFEGINAGLATLITLATLVLVLPQFTTTTPGPFYSASQLAFAALSSFVLWLIFVFVQTVRHRDYFLLPTDKSHVAFDIAAPSKRQAWLSMGLLLVSLAVVIGLAKALSPVIESLVIKAGAPKAMLGILISVIVLLPEMLASVRAAYADKLQTSMNLAIGSALACVGLTIPAVAIVSRLLGIDLVLGLSTSSTALLMLTFTICIITLASGRTNLMQGAIHLVLFAAFLFLTYVP